MPRINFSRPGRFLLFFIPILYLIFLRIFLAQGFSLPTLIIPGILTIVVLLLAPWLQYEPSGAGSGKINLAWVLFALIATASIALTISTESQVCAWISLAAFLILSLGIHRSWLGKPKSLKWWIFTPLIGAVFCSLPVLLNQILTRFSEEEFFTVAQFGIFLIYWLLMAFINIYNPQFLKLPALPWIKAINSRILLPAGLLLFFLFGWLVVKDYQLSFYSQNSDLYPGISNDSPFLCGTAAQSEILAPGNTFYQDYINKIEAKPNLDTSEEGLLFLATSDVKWAKAFHDSLLIEASQKRFTQPANSVKYDQFLASLRVYTYARVRTQAPNLFTATEQATLADWFHAINRRALTVEWVDWMYGLAFSMTPEGPYENQENGEGLIALLEAEKLADPNLSQQNRDYLARHQNGWQKRFRNTDDSLNYQYEWITNATFQQLYTGNAPAQNVQNSFEWMLLQMLPDGRAPQYNLPDAYTMVAGMYLGASYLKDGSYLWLADRGLQALEKDPLNLSLQPGDEQQVSIAETSPTPGSCLLYGGSGLPSQVGPLAPDKVVFRDGWSAGDNYLLLNLRFMGWHRYKGTNTITLVDNGSPLIDEQISGADFPWLPKGRSAFRDKRIPRENLNGLQIQRQGLDAVLYQLLGYGSAWAQDPPFTAQVSDFSTSAVMDSSQTSIVNWHGWTQNRKIYFVHKGIIVVVDDAQGPPSETASITWNLNNLQPTDMVGRYRLGDKSRPADFILLDQGTGKVVNSHPSGASGDPSGQILYTGPATGKLHLVSVILTGDWQGAEVGISESGGQENLNIQKSGQAFTLDLTSK